jgi:hypothetical protein
MSPEARPWFQRSVKALGIGLVVAALAEELRKPRESRTWHGAIAGLVPYDFRPPTVARVRDRMWAPQHQRILVPQVFGVGWTVNLGRVVALVRGRP